MSEQFYTKEELELLGGSAPADGQFQQAQPPIGAEMPQQPYQQGIQQIPYQQGMPYQPPMQQGMQQMPYQQQGVQYQQMENAPQFIKDIQGPSSSTYRKVNMGVSVYRSVVQIIAGLIFVLMPLFMLTSMLSAMKTDGSSDPVVLVPILMISLFVLVGAGIVVKAVVSLISTFKNK